MTDCNNHAAEGPNDDKECQLPAEIRKKVIKMVEASEKTACAQMIPRTNCVGPMLWSGFVPLVSGLNADARQLQVSEGLLASNVS
jgi:hypothetical protein